MYPWGVVQTSVGIGRKLLYLLPHSFQQSSGQKDAVCVPGPGSVPSRRGHDMTSRQHGSLGDLARRLHSRHGPGFGWSFLVYVGRAFLGSSGMLAVVCGKALLRCRYWLSRYDADMEGGRLESLDGNRCNAMV